jgi:predicted esterase
MIMATRFEILEGVKVVVMNGLAQPGPTRGVVNALPENFEAPKVVVVMGRSDKINPPETSSEGVKAMREAGWEVEVVQHDGGHEFMADEEVVRRVVGGVVEVLGL